MLKEGFKFGFGFFIGYEIAKHVNEIAGKLYLLLKDKKK